MASKFAWKPFFVPLWQSIFVVLKACLSKCVECVGVGICGGVGRDILGNIVACVIPKPSTG